MSEPFGAGWRTFTRGWAAIASVVAGRWSRSCRGAARPAPGAGVLRRAGCLLVVPQEPRAAVAMTGTAVARDRSRDGDDRAPRAGGQRGVHSGQIRGRAGGVARSDVDNAVVAAERAHRPLCVRPPSVRPTRRRQPPEPGWLSGGPGGQRSTEDCDDPPQPETAHDPAATDRADREDSGRPVADGVPVSPRLWTPAEDWATTGGRGRGWCRPSSEGGSGLRRTAPAPSLVEGTFAASG
jgi:hypothetical protein